MEYNLIMEEEKKWELSLKEIEDTLYFQKDIVKTIHNKSNWVVVTNVAFIIGLLGFRELDNLIVFFASMMFSVSLFFSFKNFLGIKFYRGVKPQGMIDFSKSNDYLSLLKKISSSKIGLDKKNEEVLSEMTHNLKYSLYLLGVGISFILLSLIFKLVVLSTSNCLIYVL